MYLAAIQTPMKALLSHGCVEHACAVLIDVMMVLLHAACTLLHDAEHSAASAALWDCRDESVRPCWQDGVLLVHLDLGKFQTGSGRD